MSASSRAASVATIASAAFASLLASPFAAGQGLFHQENGSLGARLGRAVCGVGDVDHDGRSDYAIASPYETVGGGQPGRVRIHSGATGKVLFTFQGDGPSDEFGWDVDDAGDVDGDGTPDLIVGAVGNDLVAPAAGMARVLSGADGATLYTFHGEKAFNLFGSDVEGMGDVDQDGFADFAISAARTFDESGVYPSTTPGIASLYSGKTGTILFTWKGNAGADAFGSLGKAGDVNGDGWLDVAIGAWGPEGSVGHAWVFSGKDGSVIHALAGDYAGDDFGFGVDGVGDVDHDGRADIAVSSPGWDAVLAGFPVAGDVTIRSGATGAALRTLSGAQPRELFGSWHVCLGDADGDGEPELAVASSPFHPSTGLYSDATVKVFSLAAGAPSDPLYTYAVDGSTPFDLVAFVGAAGDVNGDGFADLIAGAQVAADNGYESGEAQVLWLGKTNCGSFVSYGAPCAPPGGSAPTLALTGCATAGGFIDLSITNGKPNGAALVFLGLGPASFPIGGGCSWYLSTPLPAVIGPLPLSGFGPDPGSFHLTAMLPLGIPPFVLHHQAIVLDAAAPLGFTTTDAVKETAQ